MVWLPTPSAVVLNDAWPEPFTVTLDAQIVAPSVKVTVPTGTPPLEVVVEVKVTDWPKTEGFGEDVAAVAVAVALPFTTCGAAFPLLFPHPAAPVKVAVMVWLPTARAVVLNDAWPEPFTVTLDAQIEAPSVKVTVPTGTPPLEVVVEVKVTDWPKTEGFGEELAVVAVVYMFWTVCTVLPLLAAKFVSEA